MEDLTTLKPEAHKVEKYKTLLPQLDALIAGESNSTANAANLCAAIFSSFDVLWVGFYFMDEEYNQLVLGPFQGPIACTRIDFGKGVCGTAWKTGQTQVVPNVEAFPGHIACSSLSKSEIVVPIFKNGKLLFVLDIDSEMLNAFDKIDQEYLETLLNKFSKHLV